MNRKFGLIVFCVALAAAISFFTGISEAAAHRLNVFAWLKDDNVVVECNFGEKRPAANANVVILDATDNKPLLHGKTNAQGLFTFKVPSVVRVGHGLAIDVNAGQGHRNVWHMDASEFYEAASLIAGFEQAAIEGKNSGAQPSQPPAATAPNTKAQAPALPVAENAVMPPKDMTIDHADYVRKAVREELETHMEPIRRHIAQSSSKGPGFVEIVGGIGWIVGIIGIILYFRSRRGDL